MSESIPGVSRKTMPATTTPLPVHRWVRPNVRDGDTAGAHEVS
jgi:hypothetical protein